MQIENSVNTQKYAIGTFLNLTFLMSTFEPEKFGVALSFMLLVVLSQLCLVLFGLKLLGFENMRTVLPGPVLGILKLALLVMAFFFALRYTENKVLFLVLSYTFQLIILVISIKRVVKKN